MKRLYIILIACLFATAMQAQRITHTYNDVSLSDALRELSRQQTGYTLYFLYDELEDFRITTSVSRKSVPDAIRQMIGFYPISMTVDESDDGVKKIFVECTQKTDRHLTGTVVDEQGLPVPYANIALLNPADSAFIGGGVSNESGYFAIPYEQNAVIARVSYIGYKTVYRLCHHAKVGTVRLQPDSYALQGVTVKGEKPAMKMIGGGMEIDVQNTLLAQAGSATDVLAQLPRVNVSAGGAVEVFGKGTPQIYINGRKMRNKAELEQLTSKDIKSVEVITTPGAKYDAQLGSVIRINTVKRQGDGFSLYSMARASYTHAFANAAGVSMTYRRNGLEMTFYPYFVNSFSGEDNRFGSTLHLDRYDMNTMQVGKHSSRTQSIIPDFKLSYDFNANHSVGASYRYQKTLKYDGSMHSTYTVRHDDALQGTVEQQSTHDMDVVYHNANVYYTGKMGQWSINADGSFVHTVVDRSMDITESSLEYDDRTVHTTSRQDSRLYAGKVMASYKLPKGELTFGTELTFSHVNADNHNPEGYINESDNEIREHNYAGFATYSLPLGRWSLEAGVRYERVRSDFYNFGVKDEDVSRRYSDLFPTLSASWNKGKWGAQLSYTKKTRRPSYGQLRSYQQYDNRFAYEGGSPELQPAINHTLEGMLNWRWLNLSASYSYMKDFMLWMNDLYDNQEVAYAHWINIGHKQEVVATLVVQPKFGFYRPNLEVGYVHQFFDAKRYGFVTDLRRPAFYFALNNRFVIDKTCWIGLRSRMHTSHDNTSQEVKAGGYVSAQAYKSFLNGALGINLSVNDIFNTSREKWQMRTHSVSASKDCDNYSRGITLQLTYRLNTTKSKYKGTGAGNEEQRRL